MPELADLLRRHGPASLAQSHDRLLPSHRRAIQDLCACRTQALGGQLYRCPQCQPEPYQSHACQNRHCPKRQPDQADRWRDQQRALLLPVPHFLATFTLPGGLRRLARGHQKVVYTLLFQASQPALQTLAVDPKYLGGLLGLIGVLQSGTRDLRYPPQVHALSPGGGLIPDGPTGRSARHHALFPEKPLAQLFRATFRELLTKAGLFDQVPREIWHQDCVVDILAVGGGEAAWKYLAPYVFRVALSNRNLLALKDGHVPFQYRHAPTDTTQTTTLPAETFLGRFLQHVLPRGFQKVRTYGLLHPRQRARLAMAKAYLPPDSPQAIDPFRSAHRLSSGRGSLSPLRLRDAPPPRDPQTARPPVMRPFPLNPSHRPAPVSRAGRTTANPYPRRAPQAVRECSALFALACAPPSHLPRSHPAPASAATPA